MGASATPVLVTGGTGFVGAYVVRALLRRGERPRCLVRATSTLRNLEGLPVEIVLGELKDPPSLARALKGVATVYHCAADYRLYAADPRAIYAYNVERTRNLLRAAAGAGKTQMVYNSSVRVRRR